MPIACWLLRGPPGLHGPTPAGAGRRRVTCVETYMSYDARAALGLNGRAIGTIECGFAWCLHRRATEVTAVEHTQMSSSYRIVQAQLKPEVPSIASARVTVRRPVATRMVPHVHTSTNHARRLHTQGAIPTRIPHS